MTWQAEQVEEKFSELLDASLKEGPQVVERDGKEVAVLLSFEQWARFRDGNRTNEDLQEKTRYRVAKGLPTLKDILLDPNGPTFDDMTIPDRKQMF
jgi:antitoxin Phd